MNPKGGHSADFNSEGMFLRVVFVVSVGHMLTITHHVRTQASNGLHFPEKAILG